MQKQPLTEASGLAQQVLAALPLILPGPTSVAGAQLDWMCGYLSVNAANQLNIEPSPFFANFTACFDQAFIAGATYAQIDTARVLAMGFAPVSTAAIAVANFAVRMALIEQSRILAAMTFTNREQIDTYIDQINSSFHTAIETAADNMDNVTYTALVALRGAVVNDLSTRALPLPQIVTFTLQRRLPALTLAQRLYQDPSQTAALIAMNAGAVHPLFMPQTVLGLSI